MTDGPYFNFNHKSTPILARPVTTRRVIQTDRGKIVAEPGDWEALNPKTGIRYVLSRDLVNQLYDPADGEAEEALK